MQAIRTQAQVTKKKSLLRIAARMFGAICDTALELEETNSTNSLRNDQLIDKTGLYEPDNQNYRFGYRFDGRDDCLTIDELDRQAAEAWIKGK